MENFDAGGTGGAAGGPLNERWSDLAYRSARRGIHSKRRRRVARGHRGSDAD